MMSPLEKSEHINARSEFLFQEHRQKLCRQTDRAFGFLFIVQWLAGIVAAILISPRTWSGIESSVHAHVYAAVFLGGLISILPTALAFLRPGKTSTRYIISVAQMLTSALLIHLSGGRIETHFHVFGSLAFLAMYRDWKVLVPATIVVAMDHFLRGVYWPESVFGILTAEPWRWLEHAAWVLFEDIFLFFACRRGVQEMKEIALRTAELETLNQQIEAAVIKRTHELLESEEKTRMIIETANDAFIGTDEKGIIHEWNREAENMFQRPREKAMGMRFAENFISEESREIYQNGINKFLHNGKSRPSNKCIELTALRDGKKFPVEITVSPIRYNGSYRFNVFVRDIAERKKAEEELRSIQSQIIQAEKMNSIGRLASGVAHEVKNPLAILGQGLEFLMKSDETREPNVQMVLESMQTAVAKADIVVRGMLDFASVTNVKMESHHLRHIVETSLALIKHQFERQHINLVLEIRPDTPKLMLDKNRMEQVFVNLFLNAAHAMPEGGEITVKIYPKKLSEGDTGVGRRKDDFHAGDEVVVADVEDTGTGIPKEAAEKVFEPFFTTRRDSGGTGLGLSVVQNIIQMHKGMIRLENKETGKGARARILFRTSPSKPVF